MTLASCTPPGIPAPLPLAGILTCLLLSPELSADGGEGALPATSLPSAGSRAGQALVSLNCSSASRGFFCQSICSTASDTDLGLGVCQRQVRRGRAPSCSDSSHQVAAAWGCCVSPVLSHSPGFGRLSFGKLHPSQVRSRRAQAEGISTATSRAAGVA